MKIIKVVWKLAKLAKRFFTWLWEKLSRKQRIIVVVCLLVFSIFAPAVWFWHRASLIQKPPADSNLKLKQIEKFCHELVNQERQRYGLKPVAWNSEVARAARRHSQDLAEESAPLTRIGYSVNLPLIHHEGFRDPYHADRMARIGVYYHSVSAENVALHQLCSLEYHPLAGDPIVATIKKHGEMRKQMTPAFKAMIYSDLSYEEKISLIRKEIGKRERLFAEGVMLPNFSLAWKDQGEVCQKIVQGWMESPGHRENILTPDFDEAGMGAAYVNGFVIVTQVFIKRASCGYRGGPCCQKEGYYPSCFEGLKCQDGTCR